MVLNNNICSIIVEVDYIVLLSVIFHGSSRVKRAEDNDWRYLYETKVVALRRQSSVQTEVEKRR